jgi:hypothetical protein
MHTATAAQLREDLDQYVTLAARGETVLVATDDDRVVVEFRPAPKVPPWVTDPALADLIRRGVASPPTRPPGEPPPAPAGIMSLEEMLRDLDEARADR